MKTEAQKSSFIAQGRNFAKALSELVAFDDEYTATDAGNAIVDDDFTGINGGLKNADMVGFQVITQAVLAAVNGASNKTVIETYKNV